MNRNSNQKMKRMLIARFISSAVLGLITVVVVITYLNNSLGWFSNNKKTEGDGLGLNIEAVPNLIISNSTTEILKTSITTINTDSPFAVSFASDSNVLKPATHDSAFLYYPAGLKYVVNTSAVDINTGLAKDGETLNLTGMVPNNSNSGYFVDFVVYIASYAAPMQNVVLQAEIASATKNAVDVTSGSLMAASIDFYEGTTIDASHFRGTLNVASMDSGVVYLFDATNHGATSTRGTVPHNMAEAGAKYLTYTMRCYFDGALTYTDALETIAYINTATLDVSEVILSVEFSVH